MRQTISMLISVILSCALYAQVRPFQNPDLSDEQRLDNLISLMTLEEKLNHLSPMLPGVPRLGLKGTRIV